MSDSADRSRDRDVLSEVGAGARLKVCGITAPSEIAALAAEAVDFVGLWHGVPGGPADLPLDRWRALAAAAGGEPEPVLVTFARDTEMLSEAMGGSGVRWIQLHGYQTPGVVSAIKRRVADARVIKVLHVRGEECVEMSLIGAYEKAGVDVFLFDVVTSDGRVGSTGQSLDPDLVASLADRLSRPFLIAGGISATNRPAYESSVAHPLFLGIDVDTNARGEDGMVDGARVAAIARAWNDSHGREPAHA
jgi:phosphoribosylanthranilate isomerase